MYDFDLHDPFALADERTGLYYLYNANYYQYRTAEHAHGKSVLLYVSPDLKHFSEPRSVFDVGNVPDGAWYDDCDSPWAPEVHEWQGRYWMFVTLHGKLASPTHPKTGPSWYVRDGKVGHRRSGARRVRDALWSHRISFDCVVCSLVMVGSFALVARRP